MIFSRDLRAKLFAGETPPITGSGKCPAEAGKLYMLSSRVSLKVIAVRPRKGGGWSLRYELHDARDRVRILRRTPGVEDFDALRESFDEFGYPAALTPDVLSAAAEESSYTSMPGSLADAGEAVDERTQTKFSKQAQSADAMREQRRREAYDLGQRYYAAKAEAERLGIDITRHERALRERIARIERAARQRKAA